MAASVRKTGRAIVLTESMGHAGPATEIACLVMDTAFDYLEAPIIRLTPPDVAIPFSPELEQRVIPGVEDVVQAVKNLLDDPRMQEDVRARRVRNALGFIAPRTAPTPPSPLRQGRENVNSVTILVLSLPCRSGGLGWGPVTEELRENRDYVFHRDIPRDIRIR